jgi:predicted nuclease of predicted toxin-antitoxin system
MLRFKADENLPAEVTVILAQAGHDAMSVLAQGLGGQPDPNVATVCQQEGRVLLTLDLDFADIRA